RDRRKGCAWRRGNQKSRRRVSAVSIALDRRGSRRFASRACTPDARS
ncbi:MAG: hypothetical protein ACI82F_004648, partial [Planctomycetota bacterium]